MSAVRATGEAMGGTANGTVNGCGSWLAGMRLAIANCVRAIRSAGSMSAALPKKPSFSRSRRLSSMGTPRAELAVDIQVPARFLTGRGAGPNLSNRAVACQAISYNFCMRLRSEPERRRAREARRSARGALEHREHQRRGGGGEEHEARQEGAAADARPATGQASPGELAHVHGRWRRHRGRGR